MTAKTLLLTEAHLLAKRNTITAKGGTACEKAHISHNRGNTWHTYCTVVSRAIALSR